MSHVPPDDDFLRLQPLFGRQLHVRLLHLHHERRGEQQRRELQLRQCLQLRHLRLRAGLPLQRVMVVPV